MGVKCLCRIDRKKLYLLRQAMDEKLLDSDKNTFVKFIKIMNELNTFWRTNHYVKALIRSTETWG